ncbi:MAG TPA: SMC family ATPase, partial [Crenalkalicoccus sp.]|nr:SMC family ATPase [Crenalkalicoccus sp.]
MRPLRLALQAFSAYAEPLELCFDALGAHRLFLICGPTGAGKTSVLDALCYALFGESSGDERGAAHLRSHHADPALRTEVTLDFALGAERWRLRRAPAWARPKQRGSGTTTEAAEVALTRLDAAGPPIEREREVAERVRALLGYSAAEFRQVVLLPQGRFREVLAADPKTRMEILGTLFRTALYQRIQEALAELAKAAEQECRRLAEGRRVLLAQAGAATPGEAAARRGTLAAEL